MNTLNNYNKNKKNGPIVIVIDGEIGAGKTTLIKILKEEFENKYNLNVCSIFEPVDKWRDIGALQMFYEDIDARCYEFQTYTYTTRIIRTIEEYDKNPNAELYLLERSILTDKYVFVEMLKEKMGPTRMNMYNDWYDMWTKLMPFEPSLIVYLDTDLYDSISRVKQRNREEEQGAVDEKYQYALKKAHLHFIDNVEYPTHKINPELMSKNFINDQDARNEIVNTFYELYRNLKD